MSSRAFEPSAAFFRAETETPTEALRFSIVEGHVENHFVRTSRVASHVAVTSGEAPRLLFAFPAGNAGAAVFFEPLGGELALAVLGEPEAVERADGPRGVSVVVRASAARAHVRAVGLGSIRALRRMPRGDASPATRCRVDLGPPLAFTRTTLDGHRLALLVEPLEGARARVGEDGHVELEGEGPLRMRVTALSDYPSLTPIPVGEILRAPVRGRERELAALAFLAYEEKLLAGSWRFLTYFGRDTLLSVRLLERVLAPCVIEAALGSVIARLSPDGDVAHEEAIGEWAALHREAPGDGPAPPQHDYKMVDDDFLLAPLAASYLLDHPEGARRADAFLARRTPSGATYRERLEDNLALVLRLATPYAEAPSHRTLVALRDGHVVGEWRDSAQGLGGGRVPWNVNAALVPAALASAARLFTHLGDGARAREALGLGEAWASAGERFIVTVSAEEARARVGAYAAAIGLDASEALASIDGPISFPALALDAGGAPIPVMHSDDGFALMFGEPSAQALELAAERILRPFPAGLRTPVGVVVANPALADSADVHATFTTAHYHGTVVWSWQQAMLAAGLRRQLARTDLSAATRAALVRADEALWDVIRASSAMSTSELWSFRVERGRIEVAPFGQERGHHDESNAVQLWSTALLAFA